jgi:hypothetical protein
MDRSMLDRWTDTTVFRLLLFFSGCLVLPMLGIGVLTTLIGGAIVVMDAPAVDLEQAVFAVLSIGGAVGLIGYLRAHGAGKEPSRHDLTATLICLAVGIGTALAVAVFVAVEAIDSWRSPWGRNAWLGLAGLFVAANLVWALAGAAWMQRLPGRYAAKTGRAFDGLPVVLFLVALALATTALAITTTL